MAEEQSLVHPLLGDQRVLAVLSPANLELLPLLKTQLSKVFPRLDAVLPRDLAHLGQTVARSGGTHRLVLAVGGDGTLHQLLQGLSLDSQVLGILPCGTGNDFARTLELPRRLGDRIRQLSHLRPRALDFGTANGVRFINSAGFGIDSETLKTRQRSRGRLGANYNLAFLRTLLRFRSVEARIEFGDEVYEGRVCWVLAMNSPFIGGGTRIAPRARTDDGLLDLLLVKQASRFELLKYFPAAVRGTHLELPVTEYRQVRSLSISLADHLDYLALDGELQLCGADKIEIAVQAGKLKFLC